MQMSVNKKGTSWKQISQINDDFLHVLEAEEKKILGENP